MSWYEATARLQQAPRRIAAEVVWIFVTSATAPISSSPANEARWQISGKYTYAKLI
ncbi:hypothetical protein [Janthinobacterium sp. J1-1]|uniref:hypothetical protein n=1 Tax=unclassified Janthinobacterium TaxID=2610881 RepID=UPI002811BCC5|nr:hypothetical protein [Janthinobacterium sp. J1-1]